MLASERAAAGVAEARRRRVMLAVVAAGGVAATALTIALVLTSPDVSNAGLVALGRSLVVAVPVAVGIWAWATQPDRRFGPLLVLAGFVWSLTGLTESDASVAYSLGRIAEWIAEPLLLVLALSFPSGLLRRRVDRLIVAGAWLTVALLYFPTALLVEHYPEPAPIGWCETGCPDNAFMVVSSQPAFVDSVVVSLREAIAISLFAAVIVVLVLRVRNATRLMQRALVPVLSVALVRAAALILYFLIRRAAPDSAALDLLGWIYVLTLPGIALAFVVGLVRARLTAGSALAGAGAAAGPAPAARRADRRAAHDHG